jgi:hypothetical protein
LFSPTKTNYFSSQALSKFHPGPLSFFMTASSASISNNLIQTSADEYYRAPSPTTPMSPTLVNDAAHYTGTERPPLKLSFPRGASNILNSAVIDVGGQSLYYISSTSKYTIMISCRDNVEVAIVNWNRHSPQMAFRRQKMKCKNWLKLTDPASGNEYIRVFPSTLIVILNRIRDLPSSRTLTHDNAQFTWKKGRRSTSGHVRICSPKTPFREG